LLAGSPLVALAGAAAEQSAQFGYIGIFGSPDGYDCLIDREESVIEFYVRWEGHPTDIQGAEFRIVGLPQGSVVLSKIVHPGAIEVGDPLAAGVDLGFPVCDNGAEVVLYHYQILLVDPAAFNLSIEQHTTPSNPTFTCSHIVRCDAPTFTKECAQGYVSTVGVKPSEPMPAEGAVQVPQETMLSWTRGSVSACGIRHGANTSIFLGTDPDPPLVGQNIDPSGFQGPFDPGLLLPNTVYYWRVSHDSNGLVTGPLWSFTTGVTVAVAEQPWHKVKRLYR
jgi:hypothetical protein